MHNVRRCVAACISLLIGVAAPAFAQRLPANVTPTHYDLSVTPDLESATFGASERIQVRLKAPASAITLNAAEIEFDTVTIAAGGRTQRARVTLVPSRDQATFTVPRAMPTGTAEIEINYRGILNDQLRGLYRSKANNRRYAHGNIRRASVASSWVTASTSRLTSALATPTSFSAGPSTRVTHAR